MAHVENITPLHPDDDPSDETQKGPDHIENSDQHGAGAMVVDSDIAPPPGVGSLLGNIISTDQSPSFFALEFRLNAEKTTRPGKFVAVQATTASDQDVLVIARVNDVH